MRLDINLATRSYFDARKVNVVFAVLFAVLLLLLVVNVRNAATTLGERKKLLSDIADLEDKFRKAGGGVSEKDYAAVLASITEANTLIERKTLNWLALLDLLEVTVPEGVGVTGLTPSLKDNKLTIDGEAQSFRNIRAFMENMEGGRQFSDVYLLSQTLPGPDAPLTFTISCTINLKAL